MNQFRSSESAKRYYTAGLSAGDYYSKDIESQALWRGEAAKRLGLGEFVTDKDFAALSDNLHPESGQPITPRTIEGRTSAYDINFHCPKSLSLLYAITQDDKIANAFRDSVHETMRDIEKLAQTRVRTNGQQHDRPTGNLVWGEFIHTTTRPVDGIPDPHLHAHCFVFNVTHDPVEDRFKAAKFLSINRDMPFFEASFHARLAHRMNRLGYATERNAKGWEIAGVPNSLIQKFSRRTTAIEAEARRLGITDPAEKAALGSKARDRKQSAVDRREWRSRWAARMDVDEKYAFAHVIDKKGVSRDSAVSVSQAMDFALQHRFERASVVPVSRLMESALRRGVGQVLPEEVREATESHPEVLTKEQEGIRFATTRHALAEEREMLAFAKDGRGTCAPLVRSRPWIVMRDTPLTEDQVKAISHVLHSRDRVMLLRGGAGTGKTTMLKIAIDAIEARGTKVVTVAPSADASRNSLRKAGMLEADTLQRLLGNEEMQRQCTKGVIFCDEAGLVGTPQMKRLFDLAKRRDASVVLMGDTKQHAPVERGDALRLLESHAEIKPAEILSVVRQQGDYRKAVESLAAGNFTKGFAILDQMKAIQEIEGPARDVQIARDYTRTVLGGKSCLVVSPTHAENDRLTSLIRAELRTAGKIAPEDHSVRQLGDLGWTAAQRSDPANYENGQIVQFHKPAKGFRVGLPVRVVDRDDKGQVWVAALSDDTKRSLLPLDKAEQFSVMRESTMAVAKGDRIRLTGSGYNADGSRRLDNGAVHRIAGFTEKGDLRLERGLVIARNYGHLAHAYCSTSHASQGRTVDQVLVSLSTESLRASSAEQLYVSISRGKHGVQIYTNDRESLREAASQLSIRPSATELFPKPTTERQKQPEQSRVHQHLERLRNLRAFQSVAQRISKARERFRNRGQDRGMSYGR